MPRIASCLMLAWERRASLGRGLSSGSLQYFSSPRSGYLAFPCSHQPALPSSLFATLSSDLSLLGTRRRICKYCKDSDSKIRARTETKADVFCVLNWCRYLEALGVRALAYGSLIEAADAGHGAAVETHGMEVLLLAVDVVPPSDVKRNASGCWPQTEGGGDGAGLRGVGGSVFSPGVAEIADVSKRGWRRCLANVFHHQRPCLCLTFCL